MRLSKHVERWNIDLFPGEDGTSNFLSRVSPKDPEANDRRLYYWSPWGDDEMIKHNQHLTWIRQRQREHRTEGRMWFVTGKISELAWKKEEEKFKQKAKEKPVNLD